LTHLLDTNTCIAYLRRRAEALRVRARLTRLSPGDIGLPEIVVAELLYGALKNGRPTTLTETRRLLAQFSSPEFDRAAAEQYAQLRVAIESTGRPIGANDYLIVSIALAHDLTPVTHDVGEFGRVPNLRIEGWLAM
jgi:tRNA(fMet)-specific endonuclease VapC